LTVKLACDKIHIVKLRQNAPGYNGHSINTDFCSGLG